MWYAHELFTSNWIRRAERKDVQIDIYDNFICIWIAFNSWLKGLFGEDESDRSLLSKVKEVKCLNTMFLDLKSNNISFSNDLSDLSNLKLFNTKKQKSFKYDGTYSSLIDSLYLIRCNLFHGRKDPNDADGDTYIVSIAFNILLPLLKEFINKYGHYNNKSS